MPNLQTLYTIYYFTTNPIKMQVNIKTFSTFIYIDKKTGYFFNNIGKLYK